MDDKEIKTKQGFISGCSKVFIGSVIILLVIVIVNPANKCSDFHSVVRVETNTPGNVNNSSVPIIDTIEQKKLDKEKKLQQLKEKQTLNQAIKKLRHKYDDVEGITWYYDKSTPESNRNKNIHLYFGKDKSDAVWLRLCIRYSASDWLFVESYTIKADDENFDINTSISEIKRDNGYEGVWEWYDTVVDKNNLTIIESIISSKNAKIRYNGQQYHSDRIISNTEKSAMLNVLDAYYAYGGKID
jgi:hypothetical protein